MGSAESKVAALPLAVVATSISSGDHTNSQPHRRGSAVPSCNFLRRQNKTTPATPRRSIAPSPNALSPSSPTIEAVKDNNSSRPTGRSPVGGRGSSTKDVGCNKTVSFSPLSDEELANQLLKAVKSGDQRLVERIMEVATAKHYAIVNTRGMWESTPLIYACQYCHEAIALCLLQHGADVHLANEKGLTALLLASLEGMTAAVQQMLLQIEEDAVQGILVPVDAQVGVVYNSAVDLNVRVNPLLAASMNGHDEVVRLLLKHGARVDCGVASSASTRFAQNGGGSNEGGRGTLQFPLLVAVKYGHSLVAQLLVQHGADLREIDAKGNHALLLACEAGKEECAVALLQLVPVAEHATWRKANSHGFTALHFCALHGLAKAAEYMLNQLNWKSESAFVNAASSTRRESAVLVASRKKQFEIVSILLQSGADPTLRDRGDTTALDSLGRAKREDLVQMWQELSQNHDQHQQQPEVEKQRNSPGEKNTKSLSITDEAFEEYQLLEASKLTTPSESGKSGEGAVPQLSNDAIMGRLTRGDKYDTPIEGAKTDAFGLFLSTRGETNEGLSTLAVQKVESEAKMLPKSSPPYSIAGVALSERKDRDGQIQATAKPYLCADDAPVDPPDPELLKCRSVPAAKELANDSVTPKYQVASKQPTTTRLDSVEDRKYHTRRATGFKIEAPLRQQRPRSDAAFLSAEAGSDDDEGEHEKSPIAGTEELSSLKPTQSTNDMVTDESRADDLHIVPVEVTCPNNDREKHKKKRHSRKKHSAREVSPTKKTARASEFAAIEESEAVPLSTIDRDDQSELNDDF